MDFEKTWYEECFNTKQNKIKQSKGPQNCLLNIGKRDIKITDSSSVVHCINKIIKKGISVRL